MAGNRTQFRLVKNLSTSFSLIAYQLSIAATLLFRIRDKVVITFVPSFIEKIATTLRVKRPRLTFLMKLSQNFPVTINSKKVRITYTMKQRIKLATIITFHSPMTFVSKLLQKSSTTINNGKVAITYTPTLAKFYTLSVFDPETLATLDTNTLADMDSAPA